MLNKNMRVKVSFYLDVEYDKDTSSKDVIEHIKTKIDSSMGRCSVMEYHYAEAKDLQVTRVG